jgi:hypothetical protein
MTSNPACGTDLPLERISEQKVLATFAQLNLLIERLQERISTAVWLVAITCVRPEEVGIQVERSGCVERMLWIVLAVN